MAPSPQCAALDSAMKKKGWNYAQLAEKVGKSEQHVIDVCTGEVVPTKDEFDKLAKELDIKDSPPHDSAHNTK